MKIKQEITSGIGLGSAIAATISWSLNHSVIWAVAHGIFSWLYVLYYVWKLSPQ